MNIKCCFLLGKSAVGIFELLKQVNGNEDMFCSCVFE